MVVLLKNGPQTIYADAEPDIDSIVQPLGRRMQISTSFVDDQWLAEESFTAMYGEGDTQEQAWDDLVRSLLHLMADLGTNAATLSPRLKDQLRELEVVLGPRP
jgi:hypothetical protein